NHGRRVDLDVLADLRREGIDALCDGMPGVRPHHQARPELDGHFLITSPSFITKRTRSSALMSASGSPATATRSASLPGSMAPIRSCQPSICAALIVTARTTSIGDIPAACSDANIIALAWPRVFPGTNQHMSEPAANFTPDLTTRCTRESKRCRERSSEAARS